ncbi:PH domain-containing protein [Arenibaculum pallidiluteum]|uniref:PH domain-containing protein n=1 Tax=Arenibaculum pallidiluteum TaxID=2812559 RepID=UPI001A97C2CB|nr:PH domain-containing protein [Arenibaculum pallidiluteum]
MLLKAIAKKLTTELALTNQRVIAKFGFIRRSTIEQRLEKVDSIQVRQGVIGRLFGAGSVLVSGSGVSATPIPGIDDPLLFRNRVNEAIENAARPA